jgi:hypothetical protein
VPSAEPGGLTEEVGRDDPSDLLHGEVSVDAIGT